MASSAANETPGGDRTSLQVPVSRFAIKQPAGVAETERACFPKNKHNKNLKHWRERRARRVKRKGLEWPATAVDDVTQAERAARRKKSRALRWRDRKCTHMLVARQYTGEYPCDICGEHPSPAPGSRLWQGFLYTCVVDPDQDVAATEDLAPFAESPGSGCDPGLAESAAAAVAESGGEAQLDAEEETTVNGSRKKAATADDRMEKEGTVDTNTKKAATTDDKEASECHYRVCPSCHPQLGHRAFLSIDAVVNGECPPGVMGSSFPTTATASDSFPASLLLELPGGECHRPVADADIVKNLGLRPVPKSRPRQTFRGVSVPAVHLPMEAPTLPKKAASKPEKAASKRPIPFPKIEHYPQRAVELTSGSWARRTLLRTPAARENFLVSR